MVKIALYNGIGMKLSSLYSLAILVRSYYYFKPMFTYKKTAFGGFDFSVKNF
jgi:hypothetical protein